MFMLSALMISMPALSGNVSVLSGNQDESVIEGTASPTPAVDATPVVSATIAPGSEQTITIPADTNSNAAPAGNAAPAANSSNTVAMPVQPNPPANK